MKDKRIGFYDYTVILTYMGMLLACAGIIKAVDGAYWDSCVCLMLSGLCDTFDGAVASTKKMRNAREKHFGIQIDSLSDLISFGVLPAVFVYCITGFNKTAGLIGSLFTLCALIRLAYYNVLELERQSKPEKEDKIYLGIPVTVVALFLPLVFMIYEKGLFGNDHCFMILLGIMGAGFLAPVTIKNPSIKGKAVLVVLGITELIVLLLKAKAVAV
jgi:CDP-diacylglycerol--serine O-phosphatidyltransferase